MFEKHNRPAFRAPENMIYGTHPVLEALHAGKEIEKILLSREAKNPQIREITHLAQKGEIPIQKVPTEKLNSLTRANHQGIIAFTSLIEYQSIENILMQIYESGEMPLFVILDRVTDVRNLGAIARSAVCAGAHGIIIPSRGSAQINSDAVKTSAGALNTLPVHRCANLKNTLAYLKESGISIVAVSEHADHHYYQINFKTPMALLMGSEEDGISPEYLKLCDNKVSIPMTGSIGSLNVSVAAGIMLFETVRQRLNT
jgi:23S rRNA (guanosine2251-2'-O)-methyltransferase